MIPSTMVPFFKQLGMFSAIVMPLFNIPQIITVLRRKSAEGISLLWVTGIELCILGILPSSLLSPDPILRAYGIVNTVFFTATFATVLYYHPSVRRRTGPRRPSDPSPSA
jgi:uncharacterized protein with PQ loop repeat